MSPIAKRIHIDTTSLNKVIRGDGVETLLAATMKANAHLYLAAPIIDEVLGKNDDRHIRAASKMFLILADSGVLHITVGIRDIMSAELRYLLTDAPVVTARFRENYLERLRALVASRSPAQDLVELRSQTLEMKRDWRVEDRAIAAAIQGELRRQKKNASAIGAELGALGPGNLPRYLVETAVHKMCQKPGIAAGEIVGSPGRYPFIMAWAAMMFIWASALGVPSNDLTRHPALKGLKNNSNDFVDAEIVAASALGDTLVTEDTGFTERARLLCARGFARFQLYRLADFLPTSARR